MLELKEIAFAEYQSECNAVILNCEEAERVQKKSVIPIKILVFIMITSISQIEIFLSSL